MSELKTNQISTNDGNNVAIDNSLNLKSYTTTQRDALTSAAGDMIYNSTDSKIQFYNGSSWADTGTDILKVEYLVIAGGGGGGGAYGGGGGAGGYRNSYSTEASGGGNTDGEMPVVADTGVNYTVTVGAGGAGHASEDGGTSGSNSVFADITSIGGGGAGYRTEGGLSGGSGGGSASAPVDYPGGLANLGAPASLPTANPYSGLADVEPNSQSTEGYTSPSTTAVNIGAGGGINSRYLTGGPFPNGLGWGNALGDAAGGGGGGVCGGGGPGRRVGTSPDIGNTPQVSPAPVPGSPPQSPANPSIGGMGITLSISGSSATYGGGGGGGMSTFPKNDPQLGGPQIYPAPLYATYDGVNPWPDDFGSGGRGQSGGGNGGSIHPFNNHRPDGGPGVYSPTQYSPPIANGGNGSANRGGGGGGGGGIPPYGVYNQSSSGGAGGSGIVIIRYNKANEAFKVT